MAKTIVGLFDTFAHAQSAVNDLTSAGFDRDEISVVANNASGEFGMATEDKEGGINVSQGLGDAAKGAVKGGLFGGLTGLAAAVALALVPGIGPIAAIGPLAAFFGGATLGATAGGVIGGLTGLGVPEHEAHYYAEGIRRGGTLVTVHAEDNRADEATQILNRYNPIDMNKRSETYRSSGFTGYDETTPHYTPEQIQTERAAYVAPVASAAPMTGSTQTVQSGETMTVPVIEEQLTVGKRAVEGGGARIHTRVTETPVSESVTLREENVTVSRSAVNRKLTADELAMAFREGTINVTEHSEEAVVGKTARIVEEVTIGKQATERTETVTDTVRRTDVEVEEITTPMTPAKPM